MQKIIFKWSYGPCGPCSEIHVYLDEGSVPENVTQDDLNSESLLNYGIWYLFNLIEKQMDL